VWLYLICLVVFKVVFKLYLNTTLKGVFLNLKERTKWIIFDIIKKYHLSNIKLGKKLGYSKEIINNYKQLRNTPNAQFIENLCKEFNVNPVWILTGRGERYIDTKTVPIYKEEEISALHVPAPGAGYNTDVDVDEFGKAVSGLKEIFDSRDPVLIPAIQANIHAFQISARRECQVQQQTNEIKDLRKECEELKERVAALEGRLEETLPAPDSPDAEPIKKQAM